MPRILLVADAQWVRDRVAAAITDPDTALDTVADPEEATVQAAAHLYDAVIVDLQVGNMGGMAVTRALKDAFSNGEVEPTPIVMLLDRQADVFLARRARADAHLVKPFTAQDLRAVMSRLVPAGSR